jgi:NAD(P)-dependent dehydrogenase (short-subunit alcohol dehydrogenase family)
VLASFPAGGVAVVVGAGGGIGSALAAQLGAAGCFNAVVPLGRNTDPTVDLCDEPTIASAAQWLAGLGLPLRLMINAAGFLHGEGFTPEKSLQQMDAAHLARSFAVNAIGPALLMKHFLPLMPRSGKSVFASLSAKVGSIGDNQLGGWYSYRASKAALNQLVRTAAIELKRRQPEAVCLVLHPGTVDTPLSAPFAKSGLQLQSPADAAASLLMTIDRLSAESTGQFFNQHGQALPW